MRIFMSLCTIALLGTGCTKDNDTVQTTEPVSPAVVSTEPMAPIVATSATTLGTAEQEDAATFNETAAVKAPDGDNTEQNRIDRQESTLTPVDQSNTSSDIKITANIRRGIVAQNTMSTNAKNVKIITQGGTVTLRGPVATADEKAFIEALAKNTAGVGAVNSQLTISAH